MKLTSDGLCRASRKAVGANRKVDESGRFQGDPYGSRISGSASWEMPERNTASRPIAESPREFTVHVIPAAVLADESADLMQSMRLASDLVAGHKLDGRRVSGLLVMPYLQAQPFGGV